MVQYDLAWETYVAHAEAPNDTGTVAVIDGGKYSISCWYVVNSELRLSASLLVTPYRTQNVPPPMSSVTVAVEDAGTPIHVSFSTVGDVMAVLHRKGVVSFWKMQTRLGVGKQKAIDPIRLCTIEENVREDGELRQIHIQAKPLCSDIFRITTLASVGECDIITVHKLSHGVTERAGLIELPGIGGRLMTSETGIHWQSNDGAIFSSEK